MSVRKIIKERKKIYQRVRGAHLGRDTILFTDSKGVGLKEYIPESIGQKFKVLYKRGGSIDNTKHIKSLIDTVKDLDHPIILIWLGTCEITQKKNKTIQFRKSPYQNIEETLTQYRDLKQQIITTKPSATVLFIECPYYSITRANKPKDSINLNVNSKKKIYPSLLVNKATKGHRKVQLATNIDKELSEQIDYFNDHLKLINRLYSTPRISQDFILSNKTKRDTKVKYRKNFNLTSDGVHPIRAVNKLWMLKFIDLALELSEQGC
ncbi:unnamed protein product [Mytilus edulis]|uniref:Uncharacterized protein n=1 Tax=Mytilus edulis TaxID=6550 RepID=A0A8S3SYZ2_MYTED|nr:unnamed protein product [Mytilus edulis]